MATHKAQININATAQKVFEALTKPELIKLWQFGRVLNTNWQVGSPIRFSASFNDKNLEQWGTVLAVQTNQLIKYNLFTPAPTLDDKPENYCVTTYTLSANQQNTTVEIIQEDKRPNGFVGATLNPILAALKTVAENN